MMDLEDLENDVDLIVAWVGEDLRELRNEGVRIAVDRGPDPGAATPKDRVRQLGWEREMARGCGGDG